MKSVLTPMWFLCKRKIICIYKQFFCFNWHPFSFFLPLLCICLDYSKKHVPGNLHTKTSVTPDALEQIHERRTGKAFHTDHEKTAQETNEFGKSKGWFRRKGTTPGTSIFLFLVKRIRRNFSLKSV